MYKILIVDDEEWIREGIKNKLQKGGFSKNDVCEASDGKEALEIIEKDHHDIVICDIRMENMDGLELCRVLSQRYPSIAKIIVSAYSEFDYAAKAIQVGVISYLLKPIDSYELLNAVKICVQKIESYAQSPHKIASKIQDAIYDISENYLYNFSSSNRIKKIMNCYMEAFGTFACCHVYIGTTSTITPGDVIAIILESVEDFTFGEDVLVIKGEALEYTILFWLPNTKDVLETEKKIKTIAEKLNSEFMRNGIFGASFGIERSKNEPLNCIASARSAMKHRVIITEEQIITQEMIYPFSRVYKPQQLMARYRHALESGKYQEVCDVLKIMQEEIKSNKVSYNGLSVFYSSLIEVIGKKDENTQGAIEKDQDSYIKPLWQYNSMKDMFNTIRDMCLSKINITFVKNDDYRRILANHVKDYIDNYYYQDISLEKLAESYYITPAYLSIIFKNVFGMNFLEYRLKVRIQNAKDLLLLKEYKIKTIAEMTGFNDQHYFSRVFKIVEGITPREFVNKF